MTARVGRPRDPELRGRVLEASIELLASTGRLNADEVAAKARVGKAAIYRRWRSLDELLVDVVASLGVRDVVHVADHQGSLVVDLANTLHAAVTGMRARAEVAVLPMVGRDPALQVAYMTGPQTRLTSAISHCETRAVLRGESEWSSIESVLAAARLLQHETAMGGRDLDLLQVAEVVELVALPALAAEAAVSA